MGCVLPDSQVKVAQSADIKPFFTHIPINPQPWFPWLLITLSSAKAACWTCNWLAPLAATRSALGLSSQTGSPPTQAASTSR
jgi:hypothetical protein